jgi:glycosyltransferase involved in cell wall biosynthesis
MAAGRACIASKVGSVPEIITHETNGLLVDAANVTQLGELLVDVCKSPKRRCIIGANAREYMRTHHEINVVVPKLLHAIEVGNRVGLGELDGTTKT